jgi:hypothetical protein
LYLLDCSSHLGESPVLALLTPEAGNASTPKIGDPRLLEG